MDKDWFDDGEVRSKLLHWVGWGFESMVRVLISMLLIVSSYAAGALEVPLFDGKSAKRDPAVSYQVYKSLNYLFHSTNRQRQFEHERRPAQPPKGFEGMPTDQAKKFSTAILPQVTEWSSHEELTAKFRQLRDHRFLSRGSHPDFLRRSTWLYPDDGCYARAQLANSNLHSWSVQAPMKVFSFGDLHVKTRNSPLGEVSWWYHVAPIVEVDGQKYVLDPAIEPQHPLTLEEWLGRQSRNPGDLEVAICKSGSYTPYHQCADEIDGKEPKEALVDQGWFLDPEWERVEQLGRDPDQELGENPPWN